MTIYRFKNQLKLCLHTVESSLLVIDNYFGIKLLIKMPNKLYLKYYDKYFRFYSISR